MTQEELNERIAQHKLWLDTESKEGNRFVAPERYLRGVSLVDADLRCASFQGADLRDADLSGAKLRCSNLRGADLRDADLSGVDIRHADLRGADLSGADIRGANIDYSCWPPIISADLIVMILSTFVCGTK